MAGIPLNPDDEGDLKRALGPVHLITLGIGAIIGAGIFVLTGHAAAGFAGPGVVISFVIAGLGCVFAGLCYSEYASIIPLAGSAYTYTDATLGRAWAWFVGWNLVLEYLAASSTVAVGWSGYFNNFMTSIGLPIPAAFASAPMAGTGFGDMVATGTYFNLPAVAMVAAVSLFLIIGVKTSANFNNVMVAIKLAIVLVVIFVGFGHMVPANHVPFIPPNTGTFGHFGWTGVFRASGVIFFAYIGFDAVSVAAQEAKNPQRDIPIGILGSLVLCTILYVLMSWVETGIANYTTLNVPHPVSAALEALPATAWLAPYVNIGAIVGLASVVLVLLLGQSRIFYAMARDGMISPVFKEIHPRFATPWKGNIITGIVCALMAGVLPLDLLGELVSIGTLVAFIVVCVGVMILRKRAPNVHRPFRTPLVWITAPLGIFMCGAMIGFLPLDTWIRFFAWTALGFAIYFLYGRKHAKPSRHTILASANKPPILMPYNSLRDFLARLEKDGELVRVKAPISTVLEMTEIQTRLIAEGGPAVLFEKPIKADGTPSPMPVLVNLFGTVKRVAMGVTMGGKERGDAKDLREVGELLAQLRQPQPPRSLGEAAALLPLVKTVLAMKPKTVGKPACQEIIWRGDDIDLSRLPVQTCWPGEPAPLITWPLVVTKGPTDAREDNFNLGIYRMQVLNKTQTIMRWLKHRGGAQHHQRWGKEKTAPLPAAVVLGADPGIILAAVTPVPETLSEYQFAGLLRGTRVVLADCVSQPLKVPAEAEIVIEGEVSLSDYRPEGPYGDHTGYYNSVEPFPVFTVTAITMRKDPIYLSTYTARPPDEPSILGEALNEVFVPLLKQQFPEIVDFWLPPEGCSYRIAVVSMKKAFPGHAKRIMMAVWSYLRQFMYTKWVIVVDDDIDARNWKDVMWAISTRMDPARDITVIEHTPIDYLDFASPESGLGSKIGLDATNKLPPETHREWGKKIAMDENIVRTVTEKWPSLGLPGSGKPIW